MFAKSMTDGAPWKLILIFAAPVLLGAFLQHLYTAIDQVVVGRFAGQDALAAVGTTVAFTFLFLSLALGFSAGNGVVVAQFFGAKNMDKVRSSAALGLILLAGCGLLMTALGLAVAKPAFVYFIDTPPEILDLALKYYRVYLLGIVFQFIFNSISSTLRAVGDSASTLYFLVFSSLLNIVLAVLFVAKFNWGVAGAAFATDISQAASCVVAYFYMVKKYSFFRFRRADFRWDWDVFNRTFAIGSPIALQMAVISIGSSVIQRAVNGFGSVMAASFAVGRQLELFLNFPSHALQTTLATFAGQNVGAKKIDRVKLGGRQTMLISFIFTFVISVILWVFAEEIVGFFGLNEQAANYCVRHVRGITIINLVLSAYLPMFGLFQGTGHSGVPAFVAICALTLRCASMYIFGHSPILGYTIVWWNGIFGFGAGFIICWGYYLSGLWKRGLEKLDFGVGEKENA